MLGVKFELKELLLEIENWTFYNLNLQKTKGRINGNTRHQI